MASSGFEAGDLEALTAGVPPAFFHGAAHRAAQDGPGPAGLLSDLFVTACRLGSERPCPAFTAPDGG